MGGVIIRVAVEYTSSEVLLAGAGHGRQNPGPRMALFTAPRADQASIETRYSWVVATVALVTLAFSFGGMWIVAVGLIQFPMAGEIHAGWRRQIQAVGGASAQDSP